MKIRITRTPSGQAPLEIREQWVGVELPSIGRSQSQSCGVLGGEGHAENQGGYEVPLVDALQALHDAGRAEAVTWWSAWAQFMTFRAILVFGADFCEEIRADVADSMAA